MKKTYIKPTTENLDCDTAFILCLSKDKPNAGVQWDNENSSDIQEDDEESGGPV